MSALIIVYGMPGAGKTALCHELSNLGWSYLDLGRHPLFRIKPMEYLLTKYAEMNNPSLFVVEGCLPSLDSRHRLINAINNKKNFQKIHVFFIDVPSNVLSKRRERTEEEYDAMKKSYCIGDDIYPHHIIKYDINQKPTNIARYIHKMIAESCCLE